MNFVKKIVVLLVVLTVCFSFVNCGTSPTTRNLSVIPVMSNSYIVINSEGQIMQVNIAPIKNFNTLGLIFVESSATFDSDGNIIDGSIITLDMLMKEAHKLGADDIINLKIDEIQNISITEEIRVVPTRVQRGDSWVTENRETTVQIINKTIVYKANAVAIKYTDAIVMPVGSTQNVSNTDASSRDVFRAFR